MAHRGHIKLNEDKYRIIIVGTGKARVDVHVGEVQLEENDNEKLLGITFAKKLSIEKHVKHSVNYSSAQCTCMYFNLHGTP